MISGTFIQACCRASITRSTCVTSSETFERGHSRIKIVQVWRTGDLKRSFKIRLQTEVTRSHNRWGRYDGVTGLKRVGTITMPYTLTDSPISSHENSLLLLFYNLLHYGFDSTTKSNCIVCTSSSQKWYNRLKTPFDEYGSQITSNDTDGMTLWTLWRTTWSWTKSCGSYTKIEFGGDWPL